VHRAEGTMIVVLDTNVIVSALLSPAGPPAEIIERWRADEFEVATSPLLLSELERVLQYPRVRERYKRPEEMATGLLKRFGTAAAVVNPQVTLDVIEEDDADNRVLECAVAGGASYIVTGDAHLLRLKEYRGIAILTPAEFLTLLRLGK
jgi:putative PIN family toxin of toxin-antitoxin system